MKIMRGKKSKRYHILTLPVKKTPQSHLRSNHREIMQLFSIGIYQLNLDGSKKLDENSEPLLTYDSDDIMSFARAWTGFRRQNNRGNVEGARGSAATKMDPLTIQTDCEYKLLFIFRSLSFEIFNHNRLIFTFLSA